MSRNLLLLEFPAVARNGEVKGATETFEWLYSTAVFFKYIVDRMAQLEETPAGGREEEMARFISSCLQSVYLQKYSLKNLNEASMKIML